jgi:hypothetical protein
MLHRCSLWINGSDRTGEVAETSATHPRRSSNAVVFSSSNVDLFAALPQTTMPAEVLGPVYQLRKLTKMRLLQYVRNVDIGHKILIHIKPAEPLANTTSSKQEPPPPNSTFADLSVILCRTIISPLRRTRFDYIFSYLEETMNTGQIRQVERMMRRWLRQWNQVKRLGQCLQRTVQNQNREAPTQTPS